MTHQESLELLPWYSGLDEKQRREIDAHLRACEACTRELEEIQSLKKVIEPLGVTPEPSPFMFQRTQALIEEYDRQRTAEPRGISRLLNWWNMSPLTARGLIAAQAALLFLLAIATVHFQRQTESFSTLAGPGATSSGSRLTISFQPSASEEAIREALRKVDGTLIDGPSALGMYVVKIPKEKDASLVVAELGANTTVVRFVQKNPD